MPYDSLMWGETTQNNGLAGVAAKGPAPIVYSGDYNVLRKGFGAPVIVSLGGISATKPTGTAILGNRSYSVNKFCGPASLSFGQSTGNPMIDIVVPFQEGEQLTAQLSNTNVNEASIVQADCAYGAPHPYPRSAAAAMAMAGGGELWCPPISHTAAAAVTPAVIGDLVALTTEDLWLDTRASYHIIGNVSTVGVASEGGTLTFTGLGGAWHGYVPGVAYAGIKATFDTEGISYCYEPIPFDGDALPSYMANALTNTAVLGGLLIAKHTGK